MSQRLYRQVATGNSDMGIDFLDLTYRVERVFEIKIGNAAFIEFLAVTVPEDRRNDFRVCDFVSWVESHVKEQNPSYEGNVYEILHRIVNGY